MEYRAIYVSSDGCIIAGNLEFVIDNWVGDRCVPVNRTPKILEGKTVGYIVLFDATNMERGIMQ